MITPLAPSAGENVTAALQLAPAARFKLAAQGFAPLPVTANSPLAAKELSATALALVFFTVTVLAGLVVPTAWIVKARVVGVNESGGVLPPEPVPDRLTSCGLNEVPSLIDTAPSIAPAAVGVKVTAILHFALDASDPVQVVPAEFIAKVPLAAKE